MTRLHTVLLCGFTPFERSALTSTFRIAAQRDNAYALVETLAESRLVVADADHEGVVAELERAGRVADTVFIGSQSPVGARAWMMRPIDPASVMRELDMLLMRADESPVSVPGELDAPITRSRAPAAGLTPALRGADTRGRRSSD